MAHKVKTIRIKDLYAITLLIVMIVQVVVVNAVFVCVGLGLLGLSDEAWRFSRDAQCLISVVLFTALSNPFSEQKNEKPSLRRGLFYS
ncbi:hypothetical protein [Klebsiella pneumoniae]|uniref:hypothetical protein n=1 Tax=Klebsiella pneumoniae TaxID=573 RepID=UPI00190E6909|nr:hypothetical protein [Klebsiella pneumoniae]MBK4890293.1 hypothetical protein [Klebsiella pneumoniae]HBZ0970119.1 hypothetical protein [Klebsiella pneumoniae]HBZ1295401.1 hypothetical protein [Klebsiella pneumoniae]